MSQVSRQIVLIVHNVRSTHNVGSLLRTAEGLGARTVYLTGYTPYPQLPVDTRLPHIAAKLQLQINKTALGADRSQDWRQSDEIEPILSQLHVEGFTICALEQNSQSISLPDFTPPARLALIVGREVEGIEDEVLQRADQILEIPMFGSKESFNVVQAAAMALFYCRFAN